VFADERDNMNTVVGRTPTRRGENEQQRNNEVNVPDMHHGAHDVLVDFFLKLPLAELRREKIKWEITASNARAASAEALQIREAESLAAEKATEESVSKSRHEELLAAETATRDELVLATAKATEATNGVVVKVKQNLGCRPGLW